jgi:electron transfer flavoprotein beta subunit
MGIKKAKTKEVKTVSAATAPGGSETNRVSLPSRTKGSQILSGDARQVAHDLVEKLRFEARVL